VAELSPRDVVAKSSPRSVVAALCRVEGQAGKEDLIIESGGGSEDNRVIVAHSVTCGDSWLTQVRVMNITDEPVLLNKDCQVATAVPGQVVESSENRVAAGTGELPEHLEELYDATIERENLEEVTRIGLRALLIKHQNLFAKNDTDLGRTTVVEHDILTGDSPPIRQPPRRPPIALQPELDKELDKMLDAGVVSPGQSPWASPVVLVRKKDGSIRFCIDYRRLNATTKFDAYPLPRVDETFETLAGAQWFTTLDLLSGYWQVGLTEAARQKSAFVTRRGLFLWNVMPFGLCNAPSTFERLMETVLAGLQWRTCLIYIDDVVVFGATPEELLTRLDEVFTRLANAGLKLKPRKCKLFAREVEYLGHIVSAAGVSVNPAKVEAVKNWPTPRCVTDIRAFLGLASYYRRFVKGFATIASPLTRLTDVGASWQWTDVHQQAFDRLKDVLATAPVLAFPVPDAEYVLDTDASLTAVGAVLSQIVNGQELVLSYASKALSSSERNYCVTRRELLAVVMFCKQFRPYLYGRRFTVRTDHSSLQWLLNFRQPEGQLARWMETLSEYDFHVEHRPGHRHGNADALSRQICKQCGLNHPDPRPGRINGRGPLTKVPFGSDPQTEESDSRDTKVKVIAEDQSEAAELTRSSSEIDSPEELEQGRVQLIGLTPRWTTMDLRQAQEQDDHLYLVLLAVESGEKPDKETAATWSRVARRALAEWDRLRLVESALARQYYDERGRPTHIQWIAPRSWITEILHEAHDTATTGHMGAARTRRRVEERFWWPYLDADTRDYCRRCIVCNARKPAPNVAHHPLRRQVTTSPLQRVALDILGPMNPATERGGKYILVLTDYFSKWLVTCVMKDQTAETCASCFVNEFVCRYGAPQQLHSDQGTQFEAALFQEVCRILGVEKTRTTPLHPQGDGQTERANRTLLNLLAKIAHEKPADWDLYLPVATLAYNTSTHRITGETPFYLMFGREALMPISLLAPSAPGEGQFTDWVEHLHDLYEYTFKAVHEKIQTSHRAEAPYLDLILSNLHDSAIQSSSNRCSFVTVNDDE
jgi:transposase InsO family protein